MGDEEAVRMEARARELGQRRTELKGTVRPFVGVGKEGVSFSMSTRELAVGVIVWVGDKLSASVL